MTKDEALKMAIEAMIYHIEQTRSITSTCIAINACKEALEQPVQESLTSLDELFADEMFRLNRDVVPLPNNLIHEIAQRNYHPELGINPIAFTRDLEHAHGIGE